MTDIEAQAEYHPVSILSNAELHSVVIHKHMMFLKDFTEELDRLDGTINSKRTEYQRIMNELEALETRIVVLREKRHQLYHQAKKLRLKLLADIDTNEQVLHLEKEINDLDNRLQNANMSSSEEFECINRIRTLIHKIVQGLPGINDVKRAEFASIFDILKIAESARKELDTMEDTPVKHRSESVSIKEEFEEMESRQRWLKLRIELHDDALKYWEMALAGGEQK